ncbi:hypothetical protein EYV94_01070 [Puteibacter caeruleilacunae]|nr:hypothetical protein EYV94_01070 [Puteibacter caeruleilacunae]
MRKRLVTGLLLVGLFVKIAAAQVENFVPQPVFEENKDFVELYYQAWRSAYKHIKTQEGLIQSPYIDEAFWDNTIWIWDTEFMVMFCKYAPDVFPGIQSLNNFYVPILDNKPSPLNIQHPDNPPFYAWIEAEYFKFTNDKDHLDKLLNKTRYLQRHFEWFDNLKAGTKLHFKHAYVKAEKVDKGYRWGGIQSGMDNTPRGRGNRNDMLWIDAISQQALAAKYINELAQKTGNKADAKLYAKKYNELKKMVNTYYWNQEDGFYYDLKESDLSPIKVVTPASFWAMLAGIPNKNQAEKMVEKLRDDECLGGVVPWVTVARNDQDFNAEYGDYWRGSIWLPTAYMGIKAIEKYGYLEEAAENAYDIVKHMSITYKQFEPHTIWECYNPTKPEPTTLAHKKELVRPDFCGWSALGPISLFVENVLGFYEVNALEKRIRWYLHNDSKHGIKKLKFGEIVTDIIFEDGKVTVKSNEPYTLIINKKKFKVKKGSSVLMVR